MLAYPYSVTYPARMSNKLTPEQVTQMMERYKKGDKVSDIIAPFGISRETFQYHRRDRRIPTRANTAKRERLDREVAAIGGTIVFPGAQTPAQTFKSGPPPIGGERAELAALDAKNAAGGLTKSERERFNALAARRKHL